MTTSTFPLSQCHWQLSVFSQCSWIESHNKGGCIAWTNREKTRNPRFDNRQPNICLVCCTPLYRLHYWRAPFCTGRTTVASHPMAEVSVLQTLGFKPLFAWNNLEAFKNTSQPPPFDCFWCGSTVYQVFLLYSVTLHFCFVAWRRWLILGPQPRALACSHLRGFWYEGQNWSFLQCMYEKKLD